MAHANNRSPLGRPDPKVPRLKPRDFPPQPNNLFDFGFVLRPREISPSLEWKSHAMTFQQSLSGHGHPEMGNIRNWDGRVGVDDGEASVAEHPAVAV
jgi:hypothetical protein